MKFKKGFTPWNKGKTKKVERFCEICKKTFYVVPSIVKRGKGKFCSKSCASKSFGFQKGHAILDEWKEKALNVNIGNTYALGYKHTKEARKKMSKALKGNIPWNKGVKTGIKPWLGKKRPNISGKNCYNWKGGEIEKICEECGIKFIIPRSREKRNKNKFCSCQCYGKNVDRGLSKESHKIRESVKYKQWREKVYKRDNYQCQMPECNGKERYLNAHHIKKFKEYPDLIFDVENGITLCRKCHLKILYKEEQYEKLFNEIIK